MTLNQFYLKMLEKKVLKKKEMTEIKDIAEELNKFVTNARPNLGKKSSKFFKPIRNLLK